jgi:fatty-acyl-CoA synthase
MTRPDKGNYRMHIDPVATHGHARAEALAAVDLSSGRQWSWREFDAAINRVAHMLLAQLGPSSGARIATLGKNCVEMLLLQQACIRAGAIFVPFNWRLAPAEIQKLIEDATPAILFRDPAFETNDFAGKAFSLCELTSLSSQFPTFAPQQECRQQADEPSTLLYTSGTSGMPKGVMISASNAFWGATNFALGNGVSSASVFLCDMPLFHTAGLFAAAGVPMMIGGTVLVSQGFDPVQTLARLADPALGITHYFSVPQMAQMLWNQPKFAPEMLSGLQVYATGGAPNPKAQIERFVGAGIPMSDGFGMTETCSNFAMPADNGHRLLAKAGSIGLPFLGIEARIVDIEGRDVPDGETGELWLRGPSVTKGYWQQPGLTAAAFSGDWFKTGDAAMRDADGFYFLVDRKKDMYISGGENVYPAEVEAVIAELPQVAECAVIGVPDDKWGEVGYAFVNVVAGTDITETDIIEHCKAKLAKFKVPKYMTIGQSIPRTASGKAQKHLLRETISRS